MLKKLLAAQEIKSKGSLEYLDHVTKTRTTFRGLVLATTPFSQKRGKMTAARSFARQNDSGSRAHTLSLLEKHGSRTGIYGPLQTRQQNEKLLMTKHLVCESSYRLQMVKNKAVDKQSSFPLQKKNYF